jgi:D-alanyl-D-alanine carboxypeptidase
MKMMAICSLALLLSASGCRPSATAPTFDSQTAQLLQNTLDASLTTLGVPGATVTVIRPDGAKWVGVSGLSSIENNTPMVPGLTFRIGSLTKTMTAVVILQLVQEGRLSLDASIESILPGAVPNGTNISVRQLLNHTSGLYNYVDDVPTFWTTQLTTLLLHVWAPSDLVAISHAHAVYFAPGNGWKYSNTNYILLGQIIEKITRNSFAQEVTARILIPLGLNSTSIPATPDMPAGSTQGYFWWSGTRNNSTRVDPSFGYSAGNAISTSDDLIVWLAAVIDGTLLDNQRKTDMFTFVNDQGAVTQGNDALYGLGLYKFSPGWIGHSGDFVFGGQASLYGYNGWMFAVQTNASPPNPIPIAGMHNGADYIWHTLVTALGLPAL